MKIMIGTTARAVETWKIVKGTVVAAPNVAAGDKNWLATVEFSPTSKFGLDRSFWAGGNSGHYVLPPTLKAGDFLEYGHDTFSSRGKKNEKRSYFRVLEINETKLVVRESGEPTITPRAVALDLAALEKFRADARAESENPAAKLEAARAKVKSAATALETAQTELAALEAAQTVRTPDLVDAPDSPPQPMTSTLGLWVAADENGKRPHNAPQCAAVWSGAPAFPEPPALGSRVIARNGFGPSTVEGYYVEHGYLGLALRPDERPLWHLRQNPDRDVVLLYGKELEGPELPATKPEWRHRDGHSTAHLFKPGKTVSQCSAVERKLTRLSAPHAHCKRCERSASAAALGRGKESRS